MTYHSAFAGGVLLFTILASTPVFAQTASLPKPRLGIGPSAGIFLPTDSKTRDRFGNSWADVGISLVDVEPASMQGSLSADVNVFYKTRGDNHAFFVPVGLQYRRALGQATKVRPYVGASANLIFADLKSLQDNVHSGFKTGVGGSAFVGTTFGNRGFAEARYLVTSKVKSFNLSGISLNVGLNF